eukprot:2341823-Prorocentrum_lima.AAC.1
MKGGSPGRREATPSVPQSTRQASSTSYSRWDSTTRFTTPCTTGRLHGTVQFPQYSRWHAVTFSS